MIEIEHVAHSDQPRSAVWAHLADLKGWHEWGPWTTTEYDGEIRTLTTERKRFTGKPYVMTERVLALEPEERFQYALLSGLPLKNYVGTVKLSDAEGGGTDIHWSSRFDPPWGPLGFLWRSGMLKVITDVSERLAKA